MQECTLDPILVLVNRFRQNTELIRSLLRLQEIMVDQIVIIKASTLRERELGEPHGLLRFRIVMQGTCEAWV